MTETLQALIGSVQLAGVRLLFAEAKTRVGEPTDVPPAELQLNRGVKILRRYESGFMLGAMLRVKIVATESDDDDPSPNEPLAEFSVLYELHYTVEEAAKFSDEIVLEFGKVNGTFNVWSYWREYIQTTAARMNLPPVLLPLFRVAQRMEEAKKELSEASHAETTVRTPRRRVAPRGANKKR